jgi:hypothetical protein
MIDPETQEAIKSLSEAGWPHRKIARAISLPESTVRRHTGASDNPGGRPRTIDHRIIKALANDGYTSGEIAEMTGVEMEVVKNICDEGELQREPAGQKGRFGGPGLGVRTLRILKSLMDGQSAKAISEEQRVTTQRVYQVRDAAIEAGLLAKDK